MLHPLATVSLGLIPAIPCSNPANPQSGGPRSAFQIAEERCEPVLPLRDFGLGGAVWCTLAGPTWSDWFSLESWCGGILGTPPSSIVAAELVFQGIDHDKKRDWTPHDLERTFEVLDVDGDGVIRRGEPTAVALAGGTDPLASAPAGAFVRRTARLLILEVADRDRDGDVSAQERVELTGAWLSSEARSKLVGEWIGLATQRASEGTGTVASVWGVDPGASLSAFMGDLDQIPRAPRIDWLGMEAWFHAKDANQDLSLDAQEIFAPMPLGRKAGSSAELAREPFPDSGRLGAALEEEGRTALWRGDVNTAVQRLTALAWSDPGSFGPTHDRSEPRRMLLRNVLRVAMPSESRTLTGTLAWLGISVD